MFVIGSLKSNFDFEVKTSSIVQNWGLTWKFEALTIRLTSMLEVKVWLKGLKCQVLSRNLKFRIEVECLNLWFEVEDWNWSLNFRISSPKFKFEVDVCSSSLEMKFRAKAWSWKFWADVGCCLLKLIFDLIIRNQEVTMPLMSIKLVAAAKDSWACCSLD